MSDIDVVRAEEWEEMMSSDTPKTDELLVMRNLRWDQLQNHARTLERQNAELLAALRVVRRIDFSSEGAANKMYVIADDAIRRAEA